MYSHVFCFPTYMDTECRLMVTCYSIVLCQCLISMLRCTISMCWSNNEIEKRLKTCKQTTHTLTTFTRLNCQGRILTPLPGMHRHHSHFFIYFAFFFFFNHSINLTVKMCFLLSVSHRIWRL